MKAVFLQVAAVFALCAYGEARANVIYGSLSNFDCINDTGQTAHGFEIELDGIKSSEVAYTFGAPYNRYGTPTITTVGSNTFVRYASEYKNGTWTAGTNSGPYAPTGGHSLFFPQYGGTAAYPNVPGDHFGISLTATPTNTVYHWLLDGGNGKLVNAGSPVLLPAPVLTIAPPANNANPAAVQAVVAAPAPEAGQQMGEAIWVKSFTTVVEKAAVVDLNELVVGNAAVPKDSETEVEWQLLQTDPNRPDLAEKLDKADVLGNNESMTRRYEFYTYQGGYDPENHEALHDTYDPAYVGKYLGNQNVAVNFAANAAVPEPSSLALLAIGAVAGAIGVMRRRGANG